MRNLLGKWLGKLGASTALGKGVVHASSPTPAEKTSAKEQHADEVIRRALDRSFKKLDDTRIGVESDIRTLIDELLTQRQEREQRHERSFRE